MHTIPRRSQNISNLTIKKPYSVSTMFITHGIPSFYELLHTSIYRFADRVSKNQNLL